MTLATPGNAGSLGANKDLVIDTSAPTVTSVSSPKTNGSYTVGESITIEVTFSQAVNVVGTPQLTLETGSPDRTVNYTSGSGTSTLSFGYTVQAGDTASDLDYTGTSALALNGGTIKDAATNNTVLTLPTPGNAGSLGANKNLVIDTSAPDTQIDSGPTGPTNDSTPTFGFSSPDGGTAFQCRVDADPFVSCTTPHTTASLGPGAHTFEVKATDAAGNTDASVASRGFTVDTTAPDTQIDSGPTGPTNDSTPTFGFSSPDGGTTFQCRVDSDPFAACTSTHTTTALADGAHTFEVRATDPAGNTDASAASRSFTVDATGPQTTIDSGPSGAIGDPTPTFTFSASEAGSSFQCRIDSEPFAGCASPFTTGGLADGAHTLEVKATDAVGNTDATPASRGFTVDTAGPQTTIDSGPGEGATINDPTPTFGFSSSEAGSTFECRVDAAAFGTCTGPGESHTTGSLPDGSHTFEVRATDGAANADPTPATRAFTVQTTAPPDTKAPGLVLGGSTNQKFDGTIEVEAQCDENCLITAGGTVTVKQPSRRPIARAKSKTYNLQALTANQTAGQNGTLGLALSSKDAKKVKKALKQRGKVTAAIAVSAADGAGNKTSATRAVKLKK